MKVISGQFSDSFTSDDDNVTISVYITSCHCQQHHTPSKIKFMVANVFSFEFFLPK